MANISGIQPEERECEILHPGNDRKIGLAFQVMSISDDRMKDIRRQLTDKTLQKRARNKNQTAIELEKNRLQLLFKASTGWRWYEDENGEMCNFDGEQLEFNHANVMKVFERIGWVADQLDEFIGDEKNFFQH